jgi:uncharacterized protein YjbI with pentapeptide repeats
MASINDANYSGTNSLDFAIARATPTITISSLTDLTFNGLSKNHAATAAGVSGFTYTYTGRAGTSYGPSTVAPTYVGSYTVTASINDANYSGTKSLDFAIAKATPTITTNPTASSISFGQSLASSSLSSGAASVPGVFAFNTPDTTPSAGTSNHTVTFTPADTANYNPVSCTVGVTVNPVALNSSNIAFTGPANLVYSGTQKTFTASASGISTGFNYSYSGIGGTSYGPTPTPPTNAGSYAVTATVTNANYTGSATQTFTITNPVALNSSNIAFTGPANLVYSGTQKTFTASASGISTGFNYSYSGNGDTSYGPTPTPPTNVGSYAVTATVTNPNYTGSATQTFTITTNPTITLADYIKSFGLSGADADGTADPDGDGVNNYAEMAFGTDPSDGASHATTLVNSPDAIKLLYTQRNSGVSYTVKSFTDLSTPFDSGGTLVTPTLTNPQPTDIRYGYTQYEASLSKGSSTRGFLRVKAVLAAAPVAGAVTPGSPDNATGAVTGSASFTDPEGWSLTFSTTGTSAGGGSVSVDPATGAFTYTPTQAQRQAATSNTTDTFIITASNGANSTDQTITVAVGADAPVAGSPIVGSPDIVTGAVTGSASFMDPAGRTLTFSATGTSAGGGSVSVDPVTGAFTYTPTQAQRQAATSNTTDTFIITASNGANSADQTVTVALAVPPTATQLKHAGFSATDLKSAGFTATDLKDAGFSGAELKTAGYSAADLKTAGFSASDLKTSGFSATDLKDAGFGGTELKAAGFTASELRIASFSAADLKTAGFGATDLKDAGFGGTELKAAGFTASELRIASFSAADLKTAGFSTTDLKDAGFGGSELKDAGFSAAELKDAWFTASDLKTAGFSAMDLKAAGFTASELKATGFSGTELKDAGFTASELKDAGFSAADLKAAGFTADEAAAAGYTSDELIAAGYEV